MRTKCFENLETSVYSSGFVSGTVWNTNDDRCSDFGHFYEKKNLKMWKRLYIAQALSLGQCGLLTMIDTPILAIFYAKTLFENVETSVYSPGFVEGWKEY